MQKTAVDDKYITGAYFIGVGAYIEDCTARNYIKNFKAVMPVEMKYPLVV
jgi:hypothetical protein